MVKTLALKLTPEVAFDAAALKEAALRAAHFPPQADLEVRVEKRSIDARSRRQVWVHVDVSFHPASEALPPRIQMPQYPDVRDKAEVVIVGAGPAGLFAALRVIELGFKPVVLERGKDVRARRRDLAAINKAHTVDPDSNYCFGEGGAGTYSDGKLYTRSKKRGDIRRILEIFVAHGATEEILVDAHPHIGTNKLPKIVAALRQRILDAGGEVHFETKVSSFLLEGDEMKGVITEKGETFTGLGVILATGHSARDIFEQLHRQGIKIEAKPFALGVRVEHAQQFIDRMQYHCPVERGPYLPASSYSLVAQTQWKGKQRGVFSFCMCPGGFIVPAATSPGELVVNGMSPSRRDSKYANSGIVVAVELEDLADYAHFGPLAAMRFQQDVEKAIWQAGGESQVAPAQRLLDFVSHKVSEELLPTSYQPGLKSVDMHQVLPPFIAQRLKQGFQLFNQKMQGYLTNEAQMIGVESRTSSPVRIPRDRESFEHIEIKRLYPSAEGAGYAGGIMSAAMDGERCAEKLLAKYAAKTSTPAVK
ncbi:FAD-dependent pyridine nucleotide-disulfide oxidoreductase [Nitritalea halalkaliphila LW7]|uniref:FAD-dependent pyridine nucleotide-disulfide oxidoreductase n=1 Tax=Nitritalea halalkaliphila LW7 TaxID=1189621 RepID=I5BZL7_9BACT|nr:FAD-dependent monooxygenase [Nitritalea halalkaliphila]EIM75019.1 FAD-dependent pyridine nucleotide-disulfide oxidoreductase [Nitritalea halalkaliphila LW7]